MSTPKENDIANNKRDLYLNQLSVYRSLLWSLEQDVFAFHVNTIS